VNQSVHVAKNFAISGRRKWRRVSSCRQVRAIRFAGYIKLPSVPMVSFYRLPVCSLFPTRCPCTFVAVVYLFCVCDCGAIIFTMRISKKCLLPLSFGLWICKIIIEGACFSCKSKMFYKHEFNLK